MGARSSKQRSKTPEEVEAAEREAKAKAEKAAADKAAQLDAIQKAAEKAAADKAAQLDAIQRKADADKAALAADISPIALAAENKPMPTRLGELQNTPADVSRLKEWAEKAKPDEGVYFSWGDPESQLKARRAPCYRLQHLTLPFALAIKHCPEAAKRGGGEATSWALSSCDDNRGTNQQIVWHRERLEPMLLFLWKFLGAEAAAGIQKQDPKVQELLQSKAARYGLK